MASLFGTGWDDPQSQAIMALAGGLLRGDVGGGLLGANQAVAQAKEAAQRQRMQEMQMQQLQMGLEKQRRADATEQQLAEAARGAYISPEKANTLSTGPMPDGMAPPMVQPGFNSKQFLGAAWGIDPMKALAMEQAMAKETPYGKVDPKDYTPESLRAFAATGGRDHSVLRARTKMEVGPGNLAYDPYNLPPGTVFADPNKPFSLGANGSIVPNLPFQSYEIGRANAGAPKVAVNTADPTALAQAAVKFQNDVRGAFAPDWTIANQYKAMQEAVKNPSAQGDTAMLYSFFKVLDPASTVREGEIDMVKASRSIPDKFKGYAQKLANGQMLMPNERQDILTQAQRQVQVRIARAKNEVEAFRGNAQRLTLDPNLYVPDPYEGITFGDSGRNPLMDAAAAELRRRGK